jgi:small subunit ribosomal protein S3
MLKILITLFFLFEDENIRQYIFKNFRECIITNVEIERRKRGIRVRIFAAKIGAIIGPSGGDIQKIRKDVQEKCVSLRKRYFLYENKIGNKSTNVKKTPELQLFIRQLVRHKIESRCLAISISSDLEKRIPFRIVIRTSQERVQNIGHFLGLRIQISGRLNGAEIARTEWIRIGKVPLHTFSAKLDYAYEIATTIYGLLGIKVWIFIEG